MDLKSRYIDIRNYLSVPEEDFKLESQLNTNYEMESKKSEVLGIITQFINYFSLFREIQPFMLSVYNCVAKTIELKTDSINDFNELLIKNTLMIFIQEYIDYAHLSQKRQVLRFLSDSLEKLQIQPLIINLGLLLKPMYQDQDYIKKINDLKEIEVSYTLNESIEKDIKNSIDKWLKAQEINLNEQLILREKLRREFKTITQEFKISRDSEIYKRLFVEVMEMLSLKLTMISLNESMSDESLEPIPIK
jgi:hypothetical protein